MIKGQLRSWSVTTLIDFEYALIKEPDTALNWERDRRTYLSFQQNFPENSSRRAALSYWLQAVRMQSGVMPGAGIVKAWITFATVLILASFFIGLSYASGLLMILDQNGHVSATRVFLLTIGLQLLVLIVAAVVLLVRKQLKIGDHSLRLSALTATLKWFERLKEPVEALDAAKTKYQTLLLANVMKVTQMCVAAFSFGLVVSLVGYHFASTEIKFGWGVTHNFTPQTMSKTVDVIATPWSWLIPSAKPSLTQIEESQLTREEADAVVSPETSRAWAAFLVMSLLTYGVLLRLIFVALLSNRAEREIRNVRFDGPEVDALWKRMTTDPAAWNRPKLIYDPITVRKWWNPVTWF